MPGKSVDVQIDTKRLNRIIKNLGSNQEKVVRAIALSVEGRAKPKTRIDTGALRNSIYTRTNQGDMRDGHSVSLQSIESEVHAKHPDVSVSALPAPRAGEAVVGTGIEYGPAQEFGTTRQSGQPFLGPAVREITQILAQQHNDDLRRICTDE